MRRDPFGFAERKRLEFSDISGMNAFGLRIVTCSGADAANEILMNKDRAFANAPAWSYFIGPFFNRGIMLLDFDEHRHHRHILQQAFTPRCCRVIWASCSRWSSTGCPDCPSVRSRCSPN